MSVVGMLGQISVRGEKPERCNLDTHFIYPPYFYLTYHPFQPSFFFFSKKKQ